jgi:hypothetical protein
LFMDRFYCGVFSRFFLIFTGYGYLQDATHGL